MISPPDPIRSASSGLLLLVVVSACLAACQTFVDPNTGQTQVRWTIPGTAGNDEASREAWWNCVQFRSESWCERNLPNGRPPGIAPLSQPPAQGESIGGRADP